MRLNYNHLRYFWAVAHDGNLTRAAKNLHVSQSALSIQIKKLEEQLGHALFERRGKKLELTEAGHIALDHADAIFATGDEMVGTLEQAAKQKQIVRIGALATLSRNFQIDFLRPIIGRENVEIVMRSGSPRELLSALDVINLDIVLLNRLPHIEATTPYIVHQLATQTISLVARPELLTNIDTLEDAVDGSAFILPSAESGVRLAFDSLMNRKGLTPQIAAEVDDMAMMRLLTREGVGIAVLPPIVVKDELASGVLTEVAQLPDMAEIFYAITLQRRFPNPIVTELVGQKVQTYRAGPAR